MSKHKKGLVIIFAFVLVFSFASMVFLPKETKGLTIPVTCDNGVCSNGFTGPCQGPEDCPSPGGQDFPVQPVSAPPTQGLPTNLGQLIQQIFAWSLGILGISVFVMFFYSGFLYLTAAGNTAKIGEAKTHMTNAVFGAILLLSSYLILYTINPDFVKCTINLPGLGTKQQSDSNNPCK